MACEELMRSAARPAISTLGEVEFVSALSRKVRMRELDVRDAVRIRSLFFSDLRRGYFQLFHLEDVHLRQGVGQFDTPLRTLDALHLSLAFEKGMPLATSDTAQASAAEKFGIEVIWLSHE